MRGYKGMDEDMKCRGMQYEVGKTYKVNTPIELCHNGLHFCENLTDVFEFYKADNSNRFFEVEAGGALQFGDHKVVAECLKIIRELEPKEVNRAKYGDGNGDGYGYGYGYGKGDGYGNGYGNGYGYGDGDGNGYGYGDGGNITRVLTFKED